MEYKCFDAFMESVNGIRIGEIEISLELMKDFVEEDGNEEQWLVFYANRRSSIVVAELARKNNLFVITERITENDHGQTVVYADVVHGFCDRERYYLCRKQSDNFFIETL